MYSKMILALSCIFATSAWAAIDPANVQTTKVALNTVQCSASLQSDLVKVVANMSTVVIRNPMLKVTCSDGESETWTISGEDTDNTASVICKASGYSGNNASLSYNLEYGPGQPATVSLDSNNQIQIHDEKSIRDVYKYATDISCNKK
jgi:hypothetical protein